MAHIVKKYLNAFDDEAEEVIVTEYHHHDGGEKERDYDDDDDDSVYAPSLDDDEEHGNDSSASDEQKKEDEVIAHDVHLQLLNERYKIALEECNAVLKDKLVWLSEASQATLTKKLSDIPLDQYPELATAAQPDVVVEKKRSSPIISPQQQQQKRSHSKKKTSYTPMDIHVRFANNVTPAITIRREALCEYINYGKECPNGILCEFNHTPKKPYCNKGRLCVNKKCTFFHPKQTTTTEGYRQHQRRENGDFPTTYNKLCMYIHRGEECPYGTKCKFNHKPNKPHCNKGDLCVNKKCTFFHPQQQQQQQQQQTSGGGGERSNRDTTKPTTAAAAEDVVVIPRTKKIWLCKNIVKDGRCGFGSNCYYAHSADEVAANVATCKFGNRCRLVVFDNGRVYNNGGERSCVRIHPFETVDCFIHRMQQQ